MSEHKGARKANSPESAADTGALLRPTANGDENRTTLWLRGALFHTSYRYPRKRKAANIDRLAGILRNGLLAPASCRDGSVCSDLTLTVTGTAVAYESLVFLHRFGAQSAIYTFCDPGRFMVFVDPALPVLTPETMGKNWVILCQDEVYVKDRVPVEMLLGVIIHPADADSVMADCLADFRRLGIALYDSEGHVLWRPDPQKDHKR